MKGLHGKIGNWSLGTMYKIDRYRLWRTKIQLNVAHFASRCDPRHKNNGQDRSATHWIV